MRKHTAGSFTIVMKDAVSRTEGAAHLRMFPVAMIWPAAAKSSLALIPEPIATPVRSLPLTSRGDQSAS